jgi:hypothetical protein
MTQQLGEVTSMQKRARTCSTGALVHQAPMSGHSGSQAGQRSGYIEVAGGGRADRQDDGQAGRRGCIEVADGRQMGASGASAGRARQRGGARPRGGRVSVASAAGE